MSLSPVQEDPTCRGAAKPTHHDRWVRMLHPLNPERFEPGLHGQSSHAAPSTAGESLQAAVKTHTAVSNCEKYS